MESFQIVCTGCGKSLRLTAESAGKKGKCPKCGTEFIANPPSSAPTAAAALVPPVAPAVPPPAYAAVATTAKPKGGTGWALLIVIPWGLAVLVTMCCVPNISLAFSGIAIVTAALYLFVPSVSRSIDGTANRVGAFRMASITLLLIGVIGATIAGIAMWRASDVEAQRLARDEKMENDLAALRVEEDKKARVLLKDLESAVDSADWDRAAPIADRVRSLVMGTDDESLRTRADQLTDRVSRELAAKLEPELQKLIEEARVATDKGDYVRAQSVLTGLEQYRYCPSYRRAEALSTEILRKKNDADLAGVVDFVTGNREKATPGSAAQGTEKTPAPKPERAGKGRITRENYDKIQNGWTRQQVIDLLGQPKQAMEAKIGEVKGENLHYQVDKAFGLQGFTVIVVHLTDDRVALKTWLDQ